MRARTAATAVVAALALGGCSGAAEPDPGSDLPERWRTAFEQALENDDVSEFQREILADYQITDAEYAQAEQAFSTCLDDHGIDHTLGDRGAFEVDHPDGMSDTGVDELVTDCETRTRLVVVPLYDEMQQNPDGLSVGEGIRRCLDRDDVAEFAGATADELEERFRSGERAETPEAYRCFWDPSGQQGVTVEDAEAQLAALQDEP